MRVYALTSSENRSIHERCAQHGIYLYPKTKISAKAQIICENPVRLGGDISMRGNVGAFTYLRPGGRYAGLKSIGRFCSVALDVVVGDGHHSLDWMSTHPFQWGKAPFDSSYFGDPSRTSSPSKKSVEVGNDVWIGSGARILRGVKIGDGAVIAAGAVVSKDVPDYAIVGGIPAKLIRYRFDQNVIDAVKRSEWWDFDPKFFKSIPFSKPMDAALRIIEEKERGRLKKLNPSKYILTKDDIRSLALEDGVAPVPI